MGLSLTSAEALALLDPVVPEKLFLAPPTPERATNSHIWKAKARRVEEPPHLVDSAPEGTDVQDNDKRLLYHGKMLTVCTTAISKACVVVSKQILSNRQRDSGYVGVILEGALGTGKSTLLQAVGMHWERRLQDLYEPDENRIPVVWLQVPSMPRTGPRNWSAAFADFLGQGREGGNLTESVIKAMRLGRTQLVLIDGIDRLRTRAEVDASFEQLEEICEGTGATFVYCGRAAASIVDRSPVTM
jgi:AAA domain